ncbi:MAG: flocculation-associated PEP-CTERM protein PepA [Burkholderiales bacterium]|nr:flocculation-associated PEP-CTERM protein PepA [Burkholderiales bacterium]
MNSTTRTFCRPLLRRTAVAIAMAAVSVCASATLSPFTLNPGGASPSLVGPSFTADNVLISDFSTVTFGGGGAFTDTGYLAVSGFQLGGLTLAVPGLNSTYGLYIKFAGAGTQTAVNPALTPAVGSFSSLTYTLYGYNGPAASFGFSGNTPTTTAPAGVALASGSLINGSVSSVPTGDGTTFTPSANAALSFNVAAGQGGFFAAPPSFYNIALTAFTNTTSEVEAFDGGFRIRQGGGSFNFTSAVPEPKTYTMLLAGLVAVGFVARRRRA